MPNIKEAAEPRRSTGRRRRLAKVRAAWATLVIVATYLFLPTGAAWASSCRYDGGGFDGYQQSDFSGGNYFEGVSAFIVVEPGLNCSIPSGGSSFGRQNLSWIMLAGGSGSDKAWAQVGFVKHTEDSSMEWFSQYSHGTNSITGTTKYNIDSEIGVRHAFYEYYSPSMGRMESKIDSTPWDSSPFNPFADSHWGSIPFRPEFYDEANDGGTHVMGSATNPVAFSSVGVQRYSDDGKQLIPCVLSAGAFISEWHHSASSCTAWHLWYE